MANPKISGGLIGRNRLDDASTNGAKTPMVIPASVANALAIGDPVVQTDGLASALGYPSCDFAGAGAVTGVIDSWIGINPANATTTPSFLFGFAGAAAGNVYRPASTVNDYYALVDTSPETQYEVSLDGTNVYGASAIGKTCILNTSVASSQLTGSGVTISNASIAAGSVQQFRIVGFPQSPNNDVTQAYARYLVQINNSTVTVGHAGI